MPFTFADACAIAVEPHTRSKAAQFEAFMAASTEAVARADAAHAALSPEQKLELKIAGNRAEVRAVITGAKARRVWLRKLAEYNPSAVGFFGEHLQFVSREIARRWASIAADRAELRAMRASFRMAAE